MISQPECSKRKCRHFKGVKWMEEDERSEVVFCSAFPDGIPAEIAYGDNKHSTILPDQKNKIIYEKRQ